MPTVRLVPSIMYTSASGYLTITNPDNAYTNTDSTTYATIENRTVSTNNRYLYIRGFNFDAVPSAATVTSISIKIKGYHSGGNTGTIYGYNGTTSVSSAGTTTALGTSATVKTFTNTTIAWDTLKGYGDNFGIRINCKRASKNTKAYIYIYGAEILVDYTLPSANVTGVSLDQNTATIDDGDTLQLTETVEPSNAANKSVTWSSSNTSVATVSNGLVTGVSPGTAVITVTTVQGGYTATCTVTVIAVQRTNFVLATTISPGNSYIIADGNSGSVHVLTGQAAGSGYLAGVTGTVTNDVLSIKTSDVSNAIFDYVQFDENEPLSTTFTQNNNSVYLYIASSTGLIMNSTTTVDRYWHQNGTKLWQCKPSIGNGYTDDTSEFKNYLVWDSNNNRFDDAHLSGSGTDQVVETTTIMPPMYLYTLDTGSNQTVYLKVNGNWVACSKVYKKVNGSWVEQSDLSNLFDSDKIYIKV